MLFRGKVCLQVPEMAFQCCETTIYPTMKAFSVQNYLWGFDLAIKKAISHMIKHSMYKSVGHKKVVSGIISIVQIFASFHDVKNHINYIT